MSIHKKFFYIFYAVIFGLLSACGKGDKTTAAFEVSSLAVAAVSNQDAVLYGRHIGTNSIFSKLITSGSLEIDLPSGDWQFAVVAWDRSSPSLEGKTRCKVIPKVSLNGGYVPLTFEISTADCNTFFISKSSFLESWTGEFQKLSFKDCNNLNSVTGPGSSCTSVGYVAYTVSVVENHFSPSNFPVESAETLISTCSTSLSNIRLPAFSSLPLTYKLRAFSDVTCTVLEKEILFNKGIFEIPGVTRVFDDGDTTKVFISDSPIPSIVAKNTTQLHSVSSDGVPPSGSASRIISFQKPNHYSGNLATSCSTFNLSSGISSIGSCSCNANGVCQATVNITNPSSTLPLEFVTFSYNLSDGVETSNAANAKMCLSTKPCVSI